MSSRFDVVPPHLIERERQRLRTRFADRGAAWIFGYASVFCISLFCGAGALVAHALIH